MSLEVVGGGDREMAAAVAAAVAGAASDLARCLGSGGEGRTEMAMDLLVVDGTVAVNMVVIGVAPDRLRAWHRMRPFRITLRGATSEVPATTVVVATGQFLRGLYVNPRSHPGDGTCEVQAYSLRPAERPRMRSRLVTGTHLPHPAITVRRATQVKVESERPFNLEVDGNPIGPRRSTTIELQASAYRLLV